MGGCCVYLFVYLHFGEFTLKGFCTEIATDLEARNKMMFMLPSNRGVLSAKLDLPMNVIPYQSLEISSRYSKRIKLGDEIGDQLQ